MRPQTRIAALAASIPLAVLVTTFVLRRWLLRRLTATPAASAEPAAAERVAAPSAAVLGPQSHAPLSSSAASAAAPSMEKSSGGASSGSERTHSSSGESKDPLGMGSRAGSSGAGSGPSSRASSSVAASASGSVSGVSSASKQQVFRESQRAGSRSKLAKVREIRDALERAGNTHIVDDAEDFELVEVLGLGTFGQAELRRVSNSDGASEGSFVVIKRVPLQTLNDWAVKALVGEVMNGAAMHHRYIVRTYGAYISKRSELCIALQYAAGGTLEDTIKFQTHRGPFPGDFVTTWLSQLCEAVQHMHSRRVLHRDISSGNVFLSFEGDILLGDLGLSRQLAMDNVGVTKVGTQVGTPPYMSPELVTGQDYGTSSDVWAVGVVLFELLALARPFEGSSFWEMAAAIGRGEPNAQAQQKLSSSGYPPQLLHLASQRGLLNPDKNERTSLATILEMYPLEPPAEGSSAASEELPKVLRGPLRPARQPGDSPRWRQILERHEKERHEERGHAARQSSLSGPLSGQSSDYASSYAGSVGGASSSVGSSSYALSSYCGSVASSTTTPSSASAFGGGPSPVPLECPLLPAAFQARPELAERLLPRILADGPHVGLAGATVMFGMGGTGKSHLLASLVRHPAMGAHYQRLCWLPVGQTPDLRRSLALLLDQLTKGQSRASSALEQLEDVISLQQKVINASRGLSVLCVLDDVWDPAHARLLGEPLEGAVLVVTTRVHHLLPGAAHVHCGLLSTEQATSMLLRAGDVHLPADEDVPPAAREVVELCGRLPLTIALAAAMLQEHADDWEHKLVPLLRGNNRAELRRRSLNDNDEDDEEEDEDSVENRVITSSLGLLRSTRHHTSVVLFMMCGALPEDATVPAALFDALEEPFSQLFQADVHRRRSKSSGSDQSQDREVKKALRPRRCLKVLIEHSLLQGSIRDGIQMHDLLRAYVISQLPPKQLMAIQRGFLCSLAAEAERNNDSPTSHNLIGYIRAHLEHHAAGACGSGSSSGVSKAPAAALDADHPALTLVCEHSVEWTRLAIARGVGLRHLRAAAQEAESRQEWLKAGQLWLAACGLGGEEEGACRWSGWCALRQITPVTAATLQLEASVIRGLVLKKGMKINSPEHVLVNARMTELFQSEPGASSAELQSAWNSSRSTQLFAIMNVASASQAADHFVAYAREFLSIGGSRAATQLGATPMAANACAALQLSSSHSTVLHVDGYVWEEHFGDGGKDLRELVEWYDYSEKKVSTFKASNGRDCLLSGLGSALFSARWGPEGASKAANDSWRLCTEAWAEIAAKVYVGKITWRSHRIDLVDMRAARGLALAIGRREDACRLFETSPEGIYFRMVVMGGLAAGVESSSNSSGSGENTSSKGSSSQGACSQGGTKGGSSFSKGGGGNAERQEKRKATAVAGLSAHLESLNQYMARWKMVCKWSVASMQLVARAVGTLLFVLPHDGTPITMPPEATEWLPKPDELIALASAETAWDVFMMGVQHPSLACACVAARLGRWADAHKVATALLQQLRQPLTRYETHRLLAKCARAIDGAAEAAFPHLRAAASEAKRAGYCWLEFLATRELHEAGGCDKDALSRAHEHIKSLGSAGAASSASSKAADEEAAKTARRVQWSGINALTTLPTKKKSPSAGDAKWKTTPGPLGASRAMPLEASRDAKREAADVPMTPHLTSAGILNDGRTARAAREIGGPSRFVRSKRTVSSLKFPTE